MKKLDKKYNFVEKEKKWQSYWQEKGIFKFDWNDVKKENIYSIDTPPPHVSGALHMGHIFGYSQMDAIARFQRMFGKNVFYPVGFDDNGLPSERYVEKKIGKKSKSMDRQDFVKVCDKEIQDAEESMKNEFIKMNYSFDFDLAYRTISPIARKVSQMSFIDLYNKGALYRKEEPIIWDVMDQTALSQTEAEDKEVESQMNYIRFELIENHASDGKKKTSPDKATIISPPDKTTIISPPDKTTIISPPDKGGRGVSYQNQVINFSHQPQKSSTSLQVNFENFYPSENHRKSLYLSYKTTLKEKAKILRKNETPFERKIWYDLLPNFKHLKWTRQKPIDNYIVDFFCSELMLAIEVDGNTHIDRTEFDKKRTNRLNELGVNVVRYSNCQISEDLEAIYEDLNEKIEYLRCVFEGSSVDELNPPTPLIRGTKDDSLIRETKDDSLIRETKDDSIINGTKVELIIMTTRPELIPSCVAIFAHPDDRNKYEGKVAITPLGVQVPILFDESVEKDKGTGVMMCCTFGDGADVEKYKKYNLPLKITVNENGCLFFDNVPEIQEKYKNELCGLFIDKARIKILEILGLEEKIVKNPEKIVHNVKVGERSKSPLEILVKSQWNIKTLNIKEELHKKASEVKWYPNWMEARIHNWIDGLNWNWTISRQRFFGVPIPCWYSKRKGEEGKVILPKIEDLPVDPMVDLPSGYSADEVIGDGDVFDTWMTSSVSPQLSMQGVTKELNCDKKRFEILDLPFDLRPQGHDIIRTWAFCSIVKAYYHENKIPWKNIFVNGFCLASDGTKMSKSKGNGVDPIKTIGEFGADAVRYWALNSQLGTDTNYSIDMIKVGQKLITKLFNSAKFAEMMFESLNLGQETLSTLPYQDGSLNCAPYQDGNTALCPPDKGEKGGFSNQKQFNLNKKVFNSLEKDITNTIDKWLLSKIKTTIENATKHFENYEYNKALEVVENFFWNDFCDNYLEIVKVRCYGASGLKYQGIELTTEEKTKIDLGQKSAILTIYYVFNAILKLFAPFVPSITDEVYSCLYENEFNETKSVSSRNNWANSEIFEKNEESEKIGKEVLKIVAEVRKYKSEKNISIKEIINEIEVYTNMFERIDSAKEDLQNVCNVAKIKFINSEEFSVKVIDILV